jgi:hypothetical protein
MPTYQLSVSRRIPAAPERCYSIIADYRRGHPHILPERFFTGLEVERGGVGAGTVIRFGVTLFGRVQHFRAEIAEPRPGRELTETNLGTGEVTTFLVEPAEAGCEVTISTVAPRPAGVAGWLQGWLSARFLSGVYRLELERLEAAAANAAVKPAGRAC